MSDENVKGTQSENAGQNTANSGGADGKTYTQAELDRMFAERARQAESSLLKKLGFEKVDDVSAALGRLKSMEDGQKSELQKAQEQIAALTQLNVELTSKQRTLMAQYECMLAANRLGIVDADAAFKLLDHGKLEFDESGKPTNVEALLKGLLTERPWLAGGGTSAGNPSKIRGENEDALMIALRKGAGLPINEKGK